MRNYPWRVWLAFEIRPGISVCLGRDLEPFWRALRDSCRRPDGTLDTAEQIFWVEWSVDHQHLWGYA